MGNTESKDCLYCGSSIINCSSSSSCCEACNKETPPATAICHDKSFSVAERSSLSDIIGYVYDFSFYINNHIMTLLMILFRKQSGETNHASSSKDAGAAEDPPPKKNQAIQSHET
jgi:hypothetical protein